MPGCQPIARLVARGARPARRRRATQRARGPSRRQPRQPRAASRATEAPAATSSSPCRAIAVTGGSPPSGPDGGTPPLALGRRLRRLVDHARGGDSFTAKLPRSGRELTFLGPGVVEPCVVADEAWMSRGRFQGSRGSGEAPGAEQWVVTPSAVVRYGSAILEVSVDEGAVHASLKGGSATILPEGATTWELLGASAPRVVKGAPLGKAGSAASADRCAEGHGRGEGAGGRAPPPGRRRLADLRRPPCARTTRTSSAARRAPWRSSRRGRRRLRAARARPNLVDTMEPGPLASAKDARDRTRRGAKARGVLAGAGVAGARRRASARRSRAQTRRWRRASRA